MAPSASRFMGFNSGEQLAFLLKVLF